MICIRFVIGPAIRGIIIAFEIPGPSAVREIILVLTLSTDRTDRRLIYLSIGIRIILDPLRTMWIVLLRVLNAWTAGLRILEGILIKRIFSVFVMPS